MRILGTHDKQSRIRKLYFPCSYVFLSTEQMVSTHYGRQWHTVEKCCPHHYQERLKTQRELSWRKSNSTSKVNFLTLQIGWVRGWNLTQCETVVLATEQQGFLKTGLSCSEGHVPGLTREVSPYR